MPDQKNEKPEKKKEDESALLGALKALGKGLVYLLVTAVVGFGFLVGFCAFLRK